MQPSIASPHQALLEARDPARRPCQEIVAEAMNVSTTLDAAAAYLAAVYQTDVSTTTLSRWLREWGWERRWLPADRLEALESADG